MTSHARRRRGEGKKRWQAQKLDYFTTALSGSASYHICVQSKKLVGICIPAAVVEFKIPK